MNARLLLMIVVPLALLALLVFAFRARAAARLDGAARNARRRAVLTSILTALAAAAFVVFSSWPDGEEIRLATLPALAATVGIVLAALAELTWPRPHGERREASIAVRRGTTVRWLGPLFLAGLGASALLLVIGVSSAGPTGRAVERDWSTGAASAGPYPGIPYAVPMALALAVLAVATWWALRRVEARPALGAGLEEVDRAIRVGARVRVFRLAAVGALLTAAGLSATMGLSLIRVATNTQLNNGVEAPAPPWDWTQNAGFALLGLTITSLIGTVWALLSQSPRVPEPAPRRDVVVAEARR
jgi:hypothetical protein